MEWSKYVLSVMVGGCLLVLYGKKGTGRNKWLFGAGTGTSLMAMELAVEYMAEQSGMGNGAQYYERWSHIFRYRPAGLCKRVVQKWEKPAGGEGTAASGPGSG